MGDYRNCRCERQSSPYQHVPRWKAIGIRWNPGEREKNGRIYAFGIDDWNVHRHDVIKLSGYVCRDEILTDRKPIWTREWNLKF